MYISVFMMCGGERKKEGERDNSPFSLRFLQRLEDRPHGFLFHADLVLQCLIRSLERGSQYCVRMQLQAGEPDSRWQWTLILALSMSTL